MTRTIKFSQDEFHDSYESHRDSIVRAGRRFDEAMRIGDYSTAVRAYHGMKSLTSSFARELSSEEIPQEYRFFNTEFSERLRTMEERLKGLEIKEAQC